MNRSFAFPVVCLVAALARPAAAQLTGKASDWTVYVTNDTCPDYTWGFNEEQTLQNYADLVAAHLDEMSATDKQPAENRDRYNMTATNEALAFMHRYPVRRAEFLRRIREGRLFLSPYLNNSLWGFQSFEGALRTFYPARRLEREFGVPIDVAEHIELPSLPWETASILAGCGIRWLSVPFYDFDSTFKGLETPPAFILEGPDGSTVRVVMDSWASHKGSYAQGSLLLHDPNLILHEWLPHYRELGDSYPLRIFLASGTHSDTSPASAAQTAGFAKAIISYNATRGEKPRLRNATVRDFTQAIDETETGHPFLRTVRGSFGHSWETWPVSMAKYAADLREGERAYLAAESLLAMAAQARPELVAGTRAERERAEWCWAMLGDHAWNGTDAVNQQVNADLRRQWSAELIREGKNLQDQAWAGLGLDPSGNAIALFNSLSFARSGLVRMVAPPGVGAVLAGGTSLPAQWIEEDGREVLYFVSPVVGGFGFKTLQLKTGPRSSNRDDNLRATATELESPYYRLKVDLQTGGISSLVHKATGTELVTGKAGRTLGQTVYFDGQEQTLTGVKSEVAALGPTLARLRITGAASGFSVDSSVTVYAGLDRVDLDLRIKKPVSTRQQRLCQVFPVVRAGAVERIETTGAVIRPFPQPEGDLLPGADTRRFAIQGFIDVSPPEGPGVTIATLDAFALRQDLEPLTFEALGNDQDYQEVTRDQDKVTNSRYRYSLCAHATGYNGSEALAWSRSLATPLLVAVGSLAHGEHTGPSVAIDPRRVIATSLKPGDDPAREGSILRLWEVGGQSGPVSVTIRGYRQAFRTDLLERDIEELQIENGKVVFNLRAHGFGALRLVP